MFGSNDIAEGVMWMEGVKGWVGSFQDLMLPRCLYATAMSVDRGRVPIVSGTYDIDFT